MGKNKTLYDEIASVAFDLFLKRGHAHGYDVEDWLEAEKIVMKRHAKGKKDEAGDMGPAKRTKARGK